MSIQFAMNRVVQGIIELLGILALMSQITWQIVLLVLPIAGACILYQVRTLYFLLTLYVRMLTSLSSHFLHNIGRCIK